MNEVPEFENTPESLRPYTAEIAAKVLDLVEEHPEIKGIPAKIITTIFQAGVVAGYDTAVKIMFDKETG